MALAPAIDDKNNDRETIFYIKNTAHSTRVLSGLSCKATSHRHIQKTTGRESIEDITIILLNLQDSDCALTAND